MKPLATLPALLLAACASVPAEESPRAPAPGYGPRPAPAPGAVEPAHDWEPKSVLYARDGTPIPAAGPGAAPVQDTAPGALPARQLGADASGGRMYILELYQQAIEERDALTNEVAALGAEIERMRAALREADARIAELEAAHAALGEEKRTLVDQNIELAARLTTAQIRRLQVEKVLLEKELAELRAAGPEVPAPEAEAQRP